MSKNLMEIFVNEDLNFPYFTAFDLHRDLTFDPKIMQWPHSNSDDYTDLWKDLYDQPFEAAVLLYSK